MKRNSALFIRLALAVLLLGVTAFWLFKGRWKVGRDDWFVTPNPVTWPPGAWLLPLASLIIFGGFAAVSAYDRFKRAKTAKEQRQSTKLALVGLSLLAIAWPWTVLGPTPTGAPGAANLIAATWSDVATGYFSAAYEVTDARAFARRYADERQDHSERTQTHVATHPPGAVLFYYGARRVLEAIPPLQSAFEGAARTFASDEPNILASQSREVVRLTTGKTSTLPDSAVGGALWCAFLLTLALALTVPAVYGIASVGAGAEDDPKAEARGLWASAFFVLSPMTSLYAFSLDSLIACGTAWTLFCVARYITARRVHWIAAAGVLLALTSYLSFGAFSVWAIVGLALLGWHFYRARTDRASASGETSSEPENEVQPPISSTRELFVGFGVAFAGFIASWVVLQILFPSEIGRIFSQAMEAHRAATLNSRAHWPWTFLNFLFFASFLGWPLIVSLTGLRREASAAFHIGLAALATAVLLSFSGNVRGEVERLWLFLLPPLSALAGGIVTQRSIDEGRWRVVYPAVLISLQALQTLLMSAGLAPLVRP